MSNMNHDNLRKHYKYNIPFECRLVFFHQKAKASKIPELSQDAGQEGMKSFLMHLLEHRKRKHNLQHRLRTLSSPTQACRVRSHMWRQWQCHLVLQPSSTLCIYVSPCYEEWSEISLKKKTNIEIWARNVTSWNSGQMLSQTILSLISKKDSSGWFWSLLK